MNIANLLTIIRVPMAIICIVLMLFNTAFLFLIAGILYIIASLTDMFDGLLARRKEIVSDSGKILDPIADKVLNIGVFLSFAFLGVYNLWVVVGIMLRELIITGMRFYYLLKHNIVLSAKRWGKIKTTSQIIVIIFTFIFYTIALQWPAPPNPEYFILANVIPILMWYILFITLFSGIYYFWINRDIILKTKNPSQMIKE